MFIVKVLERKEVIRFFGVALTLAPVVNTLAALSLQTNLQNKWTLIHFFKMLTSSSWLVSLLSIASVAIGLSMLRGSSKSWKAVLFLLGAYISWQVANLGPNWKASKIHGLFFIINLGVFLFIADQLVYKVKIPLTKKGPSPDLKTEEPATPQTKKVIKTFYTKKKILIHFQGVGAWAQLMSISQDEIHLRALSTSMIEFGSREIEISLKNGFFSKTKLLRSSGLDFYFEFRPLEPEQLNLLNTWLRQQMSLSTAA